MAFVLANRLKNVTLLATQLMDVFDDVMAHPDLRGAIRADLQVSSSQAPAWHQAGSSLAAAWQQPGTCGHRNTFLIAQQGFPPPPPLLRITHFLLLLEPQLFEGLHSYLTLMASSVLAAWFSRVTGCQG